MRIELLDPRWKSQRDVLEARKAQASELQRGANVVSSLKNLARTRVDIFGAEADEEMRKKEEEEERLRRREREKVVWDGHTASKANTLDKFSSNVNFDEQIAAIHRAKGLGPYVPPSGVYSFLEYLTVLIIPFYFVGKKQAQLAQALAQQRPLHLSRPSQQHQLRFRRRQLKRESHQPPHSPPPPFLRAPNQPQCIPLPHLLSCFHLFTTKAWMPPNHSATNLPQWVHP